MTSTSRLIFASAWGFEGAATRELENEFKKTGAMTDCNGQYNRTDDVLVLSGRPEGSLSKHASILSQYIEEQKHKDLLDVPRVYRLEVPAVLHDEPVTAQNQELSTQEGELLALGPCLDDKLIPHSRLTKTWYSPDGSAGCFSSQFHGILSEISKLTGTEITVIEDPKGIQVSGRNENDVDDALAKITRIEKALSCSLNPYVTNVGIPPEDESSRFQMQYYNNLNQAARRRILTEPSLSSSSLYRSFVTVSLAFDEDSQVFKLPRNLLNPPQIGDGPGGESRIWNDFTFQEFGKGDQFNVGEIVETAHSEAKSSSVEESPSHRYLSAAKAMQVDKWVNERAEIEQTEPAAELSSTAQPEISYEPKPAIDTMKPPGIKSRRVVASVQQQQSASPSKSTTSQSRPLNVPGDDKSQSPRKKWKETFEIKAPSNPQALGLGLSPPNEDVDKRALCDVTANGTDSKLPGSKANLASNFSATKNAENNPIRIPKINPRDKYRPRANENTYSRLSNKPRRGNELIDTSSPACSVNSSALPLLFMNQPALVPEKASAGSIPKSNSENGAIPCDVNNSTNLAGLSFETDGSSSPGANSVPSSQEAASSSTDTIEQEKRLHQLKKTLSDQAEIYHINEVDAFTSHKPRSRRHANQVYQKEKLEELDRIHRSETAQSNDEVATRKYHHTMKQMTAKPIGTAKGKAEVKAKRQATLEDAWGLMRKPTKKADGTSGIEKVSGKLGNDDKGAGAKQEKPQPQQPQADELRMNGDIKHVFGALKQTLEAAEYFPGTLNLQLQFGLLLIPLLPKTYGEKLMSLDEWAGIFQPRTGVKPPTTKFVSRLTTSGSDVDHIVDLKTSKAEGKRRIFDQEDSEYCVFYEFHCRTKSNKPIIIVMNDQGSYTLKHPTTTVGGVNLHFPGQTWDAHLGVSGGLKYQDGSDLELEEAAQYLVSHSWVMPNQTLVKIFTKIPDGNKIRIEKAFMKRWTRHRYIRTDDISPRDAASPEIEANVDQDIFLQAMEVQDLIIGTCVTDPQAKRARCMPLLSMLKAARQWYEVSLVSPTIETVLKANANLELGERTGDWRTTDLFGSDASLVCDKPAGPAETRASISSSPVASAIGDAGIGHLLRLAKKIIGKMDGVGYWNYNPQADTDAVHMPPPSLFSIPPAATALTAASLNNITTKPGSKGFSFEELESIKDVGSATMDITLTKKSSPVSSDKPMEQMEKEYW